LKFTKSQADVLTKLPIWFRGSNPFAVLEAPAGFGKTYLLKHFLDQMGRRCKPLLMVEYNEAVNVLKALLGEKYTAKTVCSAFNLVMTSDEYGIKSLTCHQEPDFKDINLFIIDEASILSKDRLALIMETAIEKDIKVLFVGHRSQLPPVEDVDDLKCISPVFLEDSFDKFILKEPVRNSGEIWEFCNEAEKLIYKMGLLPNKFVNNFNYLKKYVNTVEGAASFFSGNAIALAYTNKRVHELNSIIRVGIFGALANENEILENERLIFRQPVRVFKDRLSGFESTFAQINSKKNTIFPINSKATVIGIDFNEAVNITCYELKVKVSGAVKDNIGFIYIPLDMKDVEPLRTKLRNFALYEKNPKERVKKFNLLHDISAVFNTDTRYAYAITVHQSQGSTIDKVFVDDNDINICRNETMKRKLRYVAYSRAKEQLIRLI
jgi:exodeoxyribonuclease-5